MTPKFSDDEHDFDDVEPLDELEPVDNGAAWLPPEEKVGEVAKRVVTDAESGWRLDQFLAAKFPQYSRVLLRKAIQAPEGVDVDGRHGKPSFRLRPGDVVSFRMIEPPRESPIPEDIPLDVLYEDDDLAVVNKPADMVVHPARGHWSGTLVGALAHRFAGQLSQNRGPARPGIVHRLDRDTSGAIIVAKNDQAHAFLAAQFEQKRIEKEYFAITLGGIRSDREVVDLPIGRHPKYRVKMASTAVVRRLRAKRSPESSIVPRAANATTRLSRFRSSQDRRSTRGARPLISRRRARESRSKRLCQKTSKRRSPRSENFEPCRNAS